MNKYIRIFIIILVIHAFFRFFELDSRMIYAWDQVQNSWVMKDMLLDGKFPLIGMVAKQNSGMYIGPGYYYLLVPFYALSQLDPIGGGVFVGVVSIVTLIVMFVTVRKMFSDHVALLATALYAVSNTVIRFDRIMWPVNFVPLVSLLVFYFLYRVCTGDKRFVFYLALVTGFAFHFHFTAIFFPIIILLSLPLYAGYKNVLINGLVSIPLFLIWFVPNVVSELQQNFSSTGNASRYAQTYYHGFHLQRVFQLVGDAFIEFETLFTHSVMKPLKYMLLPIFIALYTLPKRTKKTVTISYLLALWFIVPWFVLSTYSGELTNYYFSTTRPIVFIIAAFLTVEMYKRRRMVLGVVMSLYWVYFAATNIITFFRHKDPQLPKFRTTAIEAVRDNVDVEFKEGAPVPYLHYIYKLRSQK